MLVETGLLAALAPEVPGRITDRSGSRSRRSTTIGAPFKRNPEALGNAILLGSLLIPLGLLDQHHGRTKELGARFGILPLARRDVEFLRQILMLQRHLRDPNASPRHKRAIMHRTCLSGRAHVARATRQRAGARRVVARAAGRSLDAVPGDVQPLTIAAPQTRRRQRRTAARDGGDAASHSSRRVGS